MPRAHQAVVTKDRDKSIICFSLIHYMYNYARVKLQQDNSSGSIDNKSVKIKINLEVWDEKAQRMFSKFKKIGFLLLENFYYV